MDTRYRAKVKIILNDYFEIHYGEGVSPYNAVENTLDSVPYKFELWEVLHIEKITQIPMDKLTFVASGTYDSREYITKV